MRERARCAGYAAGELVRIEACETREADTVQEAADDLAMELRVDGAGFEHETEVRSTVIQGKRPCCWKTIARRVEFRLRGGVHRQAAGGGRFDSRQTAQERRLAATRRPDEADELAAPHFEVQVAEDLGDAVLVPEALAELLEPDRRHFVLRLQFVGRTHRDQ